LHNAFVRNHSLEKAASLGQLISAENGEVLIFFWHGLGAEHWATYRYENGQFAFAEFN